MLSILTDGREGAGHGLFLCDVGHDFFHVMLDMIFFLFSSFFRSVLD